MVTFNLHHGQSRIAATYEARPVGMKWRELTPKRMLMFAVKDGRKLLKVELRADEFGDVEVENPAVMVHLATLGWPVHHPDFGRVVCERQHDDRCFVNEGTGQVYRKRLAPKIGGAFVIDGQPYEGVHDAQCGRCKGGLGHEELIFRQSDRSDDPLAAALPDEAVHLKPYRHIMHPVELNGAFHCWCEGVFSNG
jgi:hypothetical protein